MRHWRYPRYVTVNLPSTEMFSPLQVRVRCHPSLPPTASRFPSLGLTTLQLCCKDHHAVHSCRSLPSGSNSQCIQSKWYVWINRQTMAPRLLFVVARPRKVSGMDLESSFSSSSRFMWDLLISSWNERLTITALKPLSVLILKWSFWEWLIRGANHR